MYEQGTFQSRLKALRNSFLLTRADAAEYFGVTARSYQRYETYGSQGGDREPKFGMLVKIADFYCVSLDWLFGRTDDDGMRVLYEREVTALPPNLRARHEADIAGQEDPQNFPLPYKVRLLRDLQAVEYEVISGRATGGAEQMDKLLAKMKRKGKKK